PRSDVAWLEPDTAPVTLDDRARDRQPEACAAVGRHAAAALEGLEDALAIHGRDARAGVGDLDLEAVLDDFGAHGHAAVRRRVADRVLDQVEEHPLQALRVGRRR